MVLTKNEIIEILVKYNYEREELKGQKKDELEELLQEHTDWSNIYPNGRDFDSEDED